MSKGIVIFAFDSKELLYTKVAAVSAKLAKEKLQLPVTLITNKKIKSKIFDNVIVLEDTVPQLRSVIVNSSAVTIPWKNQNRASVYELSPYDQTLLIDADYFIFSNYLSHLFHSDLELSAFSNAVDISEFTNLTNIRLSNISIPMYWATVVYFTKSKFAESVFTMMSMIRKNYEYYSMLYSFLGGQYRNDFSLSIALHTLSGYTNKTSNIHGKLLTLTNNKVTVSNNQIIYKTQKGAAKIKDADLHIMDKFLTQDDTFLKGLLSLAKTG